MCFMKSDIASYIVYRPRHALIARHAHPARNANPPMGVIAPSQRIPETLSMYRLPEKIKIPAENRYPDQLRS